MRNHILNLLVCLGGVASVGLCNFVIERNEAQIRRLELLVIDLERERDDALANRIKLPCGCPATQEQFDEAYLAAGLASHERHAPGN